MKILKGERWLVATRGSEALEIEVKQEVLTHEDQFFTATILKGERHKMSHGDADGPGDEITLRSSLTTWRKQLAAA